MEFYWDFIDEDSKKVRTFLIEQGVSHRMFSKIKHQGGEIKINGKNAFTSDFLKKGDRIMIKMPPEEENEILLPDYEPIDIIYEDKHWLLVNKPFGINTVPGSADRLHTLVNKVKGHLINENAPSLVPHVVTRLDRDTSGIVLLAKHKFAHAVLDEQLQKHEIKKFYTALVSGDIQEDHGIIEKAIGRVDNDFIRREVREDGKYSKTEYWVVERFKSFTQLKIQLHTGRTHQIRVHFSYLGHPLIGDELYGGPNSSLINRQALNANEIEFFDPFANKKQHFVLALPYDIKNIINQKKF
ncbi:MAG: RluA family pseudouridine synthase [Lactobacillaceae bacterium]|jgi:23S rRNA pseudouridine1911/1915/1917 synthase|nr:RluA family pseudouridine synthase [Lactobacillaceae bacterium]